MYVFIDWCSFKMFKGFELLEVVIVVVLVFLFLYVVDVEYFVLCWVVIFW